RHRRVHAARQAADDAVAADALAQLGHAALDERAELPQALTAADLDQEVAEDAAAVGSVADFRVELDAEDGPAAVADGGDRAGVGHGQRQEIAADRLHLVAVAHPGDHLFRHAGEEAFGPTDPHLGPAELAAGGRLHLAAEDVAGQLHAVTDAQDRDAQVENSRVAARGAGFVDALGAAGKDQAARLQFGDAGGGQVVADDLAEDVLLAHPARDQLTVLRAEVEDQDAFTFGRRCHALLFVHFLPPCPGRAVPAPRGR